MAHGLNSIMKRGVSAVQPCKPESKTGVGSRRIFSPQFKLQVLDSYRKDADCKGNQRATARKYGIHRRQIQKWLQVENTLRSGVSGKHHHHQQPSSTVKNEVSLNGHRQRDDDTSALRSASLASEARVPALEPPTGWRTHQAAPICVPDPATPIDLSIKRPAASLPLVSPPVALHRPVAEPSSPSLLPASRQDDVWDLSTKTVNKRKAEGDDGATKPPPVKLFKPYLDDLKDNSTPPNSPNASFLAATPPSPKNAYCCPPALTPPELYFINNNNNVCCDVIKSPEYHPAYTLHELQPKTSFYPYPYYTADYHPELSPTYHPFEEPMLQNSLKHRQSYSLDFKVSAIDYYQDSLCKGNPRAVVTKYNILRNEEAKWTPQPELIREGLKDSRVVR
ncbi:hypothetical protein ABEB36_006079 [Hypothenemus hampei]|uniref:Brinker DNA-binding domain-containing protein n=1 Tax=Hypothenemus hampei TaxID=57062 RepID=A0ABD1F0K8_HYPHA